MAVNIEKITAQLEELTAEKIYKNIAPRRPPHPVEVEVIIADLMEEELSSDSENLIEKIGSCVETLKQNTLKRI